MEIVCFGFWYFLCGQHLFVKKKKKINRFEIVLITSIHNTTGVYPYQPSYWAHYLRSLSLFVIICKNLLFASTFFNLFFLWESFWTSSFYENLFEVLPFIKIFSKFFFSQKSFRTSFFVRIFLNLFLSWKLC